MIYFYSNKDELTNSNPVAPFQGTDVTFAFRALTEDARELIADKTGNVDLLKVPSNAGLPNPKCLLIYSFFDETDHGRVLTTPNDRTKDIAGYYPIIFSISAQSVRFATRIPYVLLPEYMRDSLSGMDRDETASTPNTEKEALAKEAVRQLVGRKLPSVFFDLAGPSKIVRNSLTIRGLANMTALAFNRFWGKDVIKNLDFNVALSIDEKLAKATSALIAGTNLSKAIVAQLNVQTNISVGYPIDRLAETKKIEIAAIPAESADSRERSAALTSNEQILTLMTGLLTDSDLAGLIETERDSES